MSHPVKLNPDLVNPQGASVKRVSPLFVFVSEVSCMDPLPPFALYDIEWIYVGIMTSSHCAYAVSVWLASITMLSPG